ncbi:MAG: Ig-like domain-containing protein [Terriglobales bacterium]
MNLKTVTTAFFFLAAITLLLCPLPCPAQDVSQAGSPTIKSVSLITAQQYQTITIKGSGFGTHAPYTGDSYFISFFDLKTGEPSWQAGYSGYNDTITLIVNSWTNTKIVLGGFSGAWDQAGYDYTLGVGDSVEVQVWNPQTSEGPSNFYSAVSTEPTTTAIASSPNPSNLDQAVTFTATVTSSAGSPPDGETVSFNQGKTVLGTGTLSGGSASFTTSTLKKGNHSVTADYNGDSNFAGSKSKPVKQVVN